MLNIRWGKAATHHINQLPDPTGNVVLGEKIRGNVRSCDPPFKIHLFFILSLLHINQSLYHYVRVHLHRPLLLLHAVLFCCLFECLRAF